jgi:hypothetical protein
VECLTIASEPGIELGLFARRLGRQHQILPTQRTLECHAQVFLGFLGPSELARDHAAVLVDLRQHPEVVQRPSLLKHTLAHEQCLLVVAARDPHGSPVHFDHQCRALVAA